jgi:hypothetical protein
MPKRFSNRGRKPTKSQTTKQQQWIDVVIHTSSQKENHPIPTTWLKCKLVIGLVQGEVLFKKVVLYLCAQFVAPMIKN